MAANFPATTGATNILDTTYTGAATTVLTVTCWMNMNAITPAAYRDVVALNPNVFLQLFSDGVTIDFGTQTTDHTGRVMTTGTWYHVAMVVVPSSATNRLIYGYVNGQLNVTATDTSTFTAYTRICVGNSVFATEGAPFNGRVKDVRVWTRQLTATEIVDEMESKVPIHKQALLFWSPLDDNLTSDKSGNGHILTVGSAVTLQSGPFKSFPKVGSSF